MKGKPVTTYNKKYDTLLSVCLFRLIWNEFDGNSVGS